MKPKNLTEWFPGTCKPAREGIYERRFHSESTFTFYSRWDGECWRGNSRRVDGVAKQRASAIWMNLEWRGLARPIKSGSPLKQPIGTRLATQA